MFFMVKFELILLALLVITMQFCCCDDVISTIAGTGTAGFSDNMKPTFAKLNMPQGLTVDSSGSHFITLVG